jgi:hypothetical protein
MGYLGRRIGLSQDKGDSTPGGADGAVGGGILDLLTQGYFERQDKIYNNPGAPPSGMTATGGVISDYTDPGSGNIYRAHIFTASGAFQVTALSTGLPNTVDILSVGGGGGGGFDTPNYAGSGGGAGGVHYRTGVPASVSTYPVTIGSGGSSNAPGGSTSSPLAPFTAAGGGGAGSGTGNGQDGASSGGGSAGGTGGNASGASGHPGGTDVVSPSPNANGWGNAGLAPNPPGYFGDGSGGGGAGGAGSQQSTGSTNPGDGGNGVKYSTAYGPTNVITYAGGGSGGAHNGPVSTPAEGRPAALRGGGGGGGGTSSSDSDGDSGDDAIAGTGGGGGGAGNRRGIDYAGNGGSGTFIVRYQIASTQVAKATGGAISYYNGKTIHTFTNTGDFNNTTGANLTGCEVVILGGGGGGGEWQGGGGGAGRFYRNDDVTISPGPQTVTIGAGGRGGVSGGNAGAEGTKGASSVFNSITMIGGGAGAKYNGDAANPGPGGSGGGGAGGPGNPQSATPSDVTAVTNQDTPPVGAGNPGANGQTAADHGGGGGGGAGGGATAGGSGDGGPGGLGIQLPTTFRDPASTIGYPSGSPSVSYFVGGGGGGSAGPPASYLGGGGGGAPQVPGPNQATDGSVPLANRSTYQWAGAGFGTADESDCVAPSGLANSGSGGGGNGEGYNESGRYGGNGGSGLVLIAYPT